MGEQADDLPPRRGWPTDEPVESTGSTPWQAMILLQARAQAPAVSVRSRKCSHSITVYTCKQVEKQVKAESVSIDLVSPDPANVRLHPEVNLEAIKASLTKFGQQKPIVVDQNGIIRHGNGTYEAARALGWTNISIVWSNLQGSEATAYAIADNRTAELAQWDNRRLAGKLNTLEEAGIAPETVGFSIAELIAINSLIANLDQDSAIGASENLVTCPNCGHEFAANNDH